MALHQYIPDANVHICKLNDFNQLLLAYFEFNLIAGWQIHDLVPFLQKNTKMGYDEIHQLFHSNWVAWVGYALSYITNTGGPSEV